jgi:hypothetical protein
MNKTPKEVSNIELKEKKRDDKPVVKQMYIAGTNIADGRARTSPCGPPRTLLP